MAIQLLVLDIDGTIAGTDNEVSQPVRQAIQAAQAKGVKVAIATGRMHQSAVRFHRDIGSDMPLASYQGALVRDPRDGQTYQHLALEPQQARQFLDYIATEPLIVHTYIDDELYIREDNPLSRWYAERSQITINFLPDSGWHADPTKILAMSEDTVLIDSLWKRTQAQFSSDKLYITKSVPTFLEATNPKANKGQAVQFMAETLLGITAAEVMTVGDSYNDVEMLAYAGVGVAMGNADAAVQATANWVAPTVTADGVAAAIEEFIL